MDLNAHCKNAVYFRYLFISAAFVKGFCRRTFPIFHFAPDLYQNYSLERCGKKTHSRLAASASLQWGFSPLCQSYFRFIFSFLNFGTQHARRPGILAHTMRWRRRYFYTLLLPPPSPVRRVNNTRGTYEINFRKTSKRVREVMCARHSENNVLRLVHSYFRKNTRITVARRAFVTRLLSSRLLRRDTSIWQSLKLLFLLSRWLYLTFHFDSISSSHVKYYLSYCMKRVIKNSITPVLEWIIKMVELLTSKHL